ncbi:hypothetical protein CA54_37990 [Symmachiella macrocystis]|uniref:Uncharacterized protein n=1 Tax=Symmachiella macrocystis TaxID=2527985 RepID=A0A5C6BWB4_9PLAN|nr:hypothetical protein CA54_37990 [Symmachiella macrocystis]
MERYEQFSSNLPLATKWQLRTLSLEQVEERRLMAGSVDIYQDGSNLEVIGSADRDKLSVYYDDSR